MTWAPITVTVVALLLGAFAGLVKRGRDALVPLVVTISTTWAAWALAVNDYAGQSVFASIVCAVSMTLLCLVALGTKGGRS